MCAARLGAACVLRCFHLGGGTVEDVLRQFSSSGLTTTPLATILGFWLIWPIMCGVLGASRGQAFSGALSGFLWGPLGLLFVLVKSKKHVCPTCGQRTLRQPAEQDPCKPKWDIPLAALPVVPDAVPPLARSVPPTPQLEPVAVGADAASDPEVVKLRAWVAGDPE